MWDPAGDGKCWRRLRGASGVFGGGGGVMRGDGRMD
jgi:hypothetical protein